LTSDLGDLYRQVILDHSRHPHNLRRIDDATQSAEGINPLCGDQLTLYVRIVDDTIDDIAFEGMGCAISMASASLLTTELKGKDTDEALAVFGKVHAMLTGEGDRHDQNGNNHSGEEDGDGGGDRADRAGAGAGLGKLEVLSGVSEFPMRVKCATLAWHTLRSVLETPGQHVTTE
jgi:nitrogen fixation NifU-like protein